MIELPVVMLLTRSFIFSGLLLAVVSSTACPPFKLPLWNETKANSRAPDPFTFQSGSQVLRKSDWACRRAELSAFFEEFELGTLPPKPSSVNASLDNDKLEILIQDGTRSIKFTVKIRLPEGQSSGPFPAFIALGGLSIPTNGTNIATIIFNNDEIGAQSGQGSRGQGKFYNLYGSGHSAGAFIAWTWGVSRIIDALEILGPSITKVDTKRLGVSGCSRNGKGALIIGAFEPRIALTVPQEGGPGGPGLWHLYDQYRCQRICIPEGQPEFAESPWFRKEFTSYMRSASRLPHDHHELIGLVAPRGLLVLENNIDWLQPVSSTAGAKAGRMIYEALGVKSNMGFSMVKSHQHCQFPTAEAPALTAFLNRFLDGNHSADTDVFVSQVNVDMSRYIDWRAPILE